MYCVCLYDGGGDDDVPFAVEDRPDVGTQSLYAIISGIRAGSRSGQKDRSDDQKWVFISTRE